MDMQNSGVRTPPKAILAIRVGVTGHRPNRLGSSEVNIEEKIGEVLTEIINSVKKVRNSAKTLWALDDPVFRLISPLAEGADIIAAQAALEKGFELQCALPFEKQEYEKDFKDKRSVELYRKTLDQSTNIFEFPGSRATKSAENKAYHSVGRIVLNQSDLLIAVWDGKSARGKGGTGQIVKESLRLDVPVVWINSEPGHEIKILSGNQYGDIKENSIDVLESVITQILIPESTADSRVREEYFKERMPKHTWGFIFELFCDFFSGDSLDASGVHVKDFEVSTRDEWQQSYNYMKNDSDSNQFIESIKQKVDEEIIVHYSWADNLAKYYSNIYRSSFVTNYILAGLAVFFALLSVTVPGAEKFWVFVELVIIISILAITWVGNKQAWHQRWIDYRLLSEELRQLRFLAPLGLTTPAFRVPAHDSHGDPRNTWVNWHFRSIVRELGIISAKIDKSYLESYRSLLGGREIRGQIEYHEKTYPRFHEIHNRLHHLGNALFVLTLLVVVLHFPYSSKWLTLCAAVFPALGAAFYGIRTQGEFEQISKRSKAMSDKLKDIKQELKRPGFNLNYKEISLLAESTAEIISSETLDWRVEFQSKRLVLPV